MKQLFSLTITTILSFQLFAQQVAVSPDKNNVLYYGVDNPITVTAENCLCNNLVVKTDNGNVIGSGCNLIYRGKGPGPADIIVYKKIGNKLKEIGRNAFRIKRIPPPVFKIGPYGGSYDYNNERKVQRVVIANQQYVRADLDYFDIDVRYLIDSFSVKIFYHDSAKVKIFFNVTGKISQQLSDAFSVLQKDDIVIFNSIFAKGPDAQQYELTPLVLTIEK